MPGTDQINLRKFAYDTQDSRLLSAGIERVISVLLPGAVLNAALASGGACVAIRYTVAENADPGSFFPQYVLEQDALLRGRKTAISVFTSTERQLLIPDAIYQPESSVKLLGSIFHIEPGAVVAHAGCKPDRAQLVYAYGQDVLEHSLQYLQTETVRPLNLIQFRKNHRESGFHADCLLTGGQAFLSLRRDGDLLWHQCITYSSAADVAWQILHAARELEVPEGRISLQCMTTFPADQEWMQEFRAFFPEVYYGIKTDGRWAPVVYLLQQLYLCGS